MTVTIAEGSVARYLVREQLARLEFPNDAIGQTSQISGAIAFDSSGQIISESSSIVVDLESLTSDEERRDNYLRTRTLETGEFPRAEFVVREAPGLAWPLPAQGEANFQLAGDMTLHGVTRPLTWDATVQFNNGTLTGSARTDFPFEEFDLEAPRVGILLSVENNIRLELELTGSAS
jgi:polyisoprenoid-binding protein YceI